MEPKFPLSFPTAIGKENKMVWDLEELEETFSKWDGVKYCLIYVYTFEGWSNKGPDMESFVKDRVILTSNSFEEAILWKKAIPESRLFQDGRFYLYTPPTDSVEALLKSLDSEQYSNPPIAPLDTRICYPGTLNLRTHERSKEVI